MVFLQGKLPVVVHANQADDIASAVRLRNEFGFALTIFGGAEVLLLLFLG